MELTNFTTQVRKSGGSLEVTLDSKSAKFEGIEEGDWVKIFVQKLQKEEGGD